MPREKGKRNISDNVMAKMKEDYVTKDLTVADVAHNYDVPVNTVYKISSRENWRESRKNWAVSRLKINLEEESQKLDAIFFNLTDMFHKFTEANYLDFIKKLEKQDASISENMKNGKFVLKCMKQLFDVDKYRISKFENDKKFANSRDLELRLKEFYSEKQEEDEELDYALCAKRLKELEEAEENIPSGGEDYSHVPWNCETTEEDKKYYAKCEAEEKKHSELMKTDPKYRQAEHKKMIKEMKDKGFDTKHLEKAISEGLVN